ncbi:hypothetical protein M3484_09540 [Pseudomonas sp. GX19020]|uniref:hypothetical protein n=1 Tax=Pseudomonas sp. GX19020 TaxID=2942277 RepID=UPI00201A15A6|nr:hypothetical protein [Pseudomonas sp. GX19020]MCL4066815.1 hypothetical protein [Pseudomonas sp. GX19020]
MPQHATMQIQPRAWTRVTSAAVTALRLQNRGLDPLEVQATAGTVEPANAMGALSLGYQEAILPDRPLAQLFPGVTGAAHVWVWSPSGGEVSVSHV